MCFESFPNIVWYKQLYKKIMIGDGGCVYAPRELCKKQTNKGGTLKLWSLYETYTNP